MDEAQRIRRFWFGAPPLTAEGVKTRSPLWFGATGEKRERIDELIRARFTPLMERAAAGALIGWADSPRRRLSLILLLDQFPRHAYRGTARAFATDLEALTLTLSGLQAAADAALTPFERIFFYMPLQHAELPEAQEESVAAYLRLRNEAPSGFETLFGSALQSAEKHRDIVARFGRFPHRNRALERADTVEELAFLSDGGARFGQ